MFATEKETHRIRGTVSANSGLLGKAGGSRRRGLRDSYGFVHADRLGKVYRTPSESAAPRAIPRQESMAPSTPRRACSGDVHPRGLQQLQPAQGNTRAVGRMEGSVPARPLQHGRPAFPRQRIRQAGPDSQGQSSRWTCFTASWGLIRHLRHRRIGRSVERTFAKLGPNGTKEWPETIERTRMKAQALH